MTAIQEVKAVQEIAAALVYPRKSDAETLLMKTPSVLVVGYTEIMLALSWKLLPCWLAFIGTEVVMQGS